MIHRLLMTTLVVLGLTAPAFAQSIVLVRHAERADTAAGGEPMMAADPNLSDAGHARAKRLAGLLRDAGITAIYVTEYKRTQQTAAPLATALGITPTVIKAADSKALVDRLKSAAGHVLVVGHSNTVPAVASALTATPPIAIADDEYDNLLVVSPGPAARLLRLRF